MSDVPQLLAEIVALGHFVYVHPRFDAQTEQLTGWHVGVKEHRTEPTTTITARTMDEAAHLAHSRFVASATVTPKRKLRIKGVK